MNRNHSPHPHPHGEAASMSLRRVLDLIQSPLGETDQIVAALQDLPAVRDALLSRANSPEFALRKQISRVEHAIAVLGRPRSAETVRRLDQTQRSAVRKPHVKPDPERSATAH